VHEHLGTAAAGTVRASFGPGNDRSDVEAVVRVVETIRG
jgi:selenocysteine lyase/cysteine desulfurase